VRLTFRQIQTFLAVQREGSFAAAARRLNVSHVAISKQVATLERAVGGELFERRIGAKVSLNARGRVFLEKAPELLARAKELNTELNRGTDDVDSVRVIAGDFILDNLFYSNIGAFHSVNSNIQIEFVSGDPALETVNSMSNRQVDLGYFSLPVHAQPTKGELLAIVTAGLFASPNAPWAKAWRNGDVEPLPVLFPLAGTRLESMMRKSLHNGGLTHYRVAAHVQKESARRELAISGVGAILTVTESVRDYLERGELIEMCHLFSQHRLARYVFRNPSSRGQQIDIVEKFLSDVVRATSVEKVHAHQPANN